MREAKFTKSLTVALPIDVYQKIKEITDDQKISLAQWVRRAVNMALEGDAAEGE
jgi:predicted HicB family RNase H-like nuclease